MNNLITSGELLQLLPFITMLAGPVLMIFLISIRRNHTFTWILTLLSFALTLAFAVYLMDKEPYVSPLLTIDRFSLLYTGMFASAGFLVTLLAKRYLDNLSERREEFYLLLLFATLGSSLMVSSNGFASLFLSLELLGISLYALISYIHRSGKAIEAGLKYLILAALSSAVLIFGVALVYYETGGLSYSSIGTYLSQHTFSPLLVAGIGMIIAGAGFKLSLVPFHWWTSDVYQGSNAPVTAFIATVSKGGMVGALIRFFTMIHGTEYQQVVLVLTILAAASMLIGNILAVRQNNLKRLLAYSSIAHLGYLMISLIAFGDGGTQAATFYLYAYFATTLGAFGVISILSDSQGEAEELEKYKGLFWKKPVLAAFLALIMFSLAGIPLTAGFAGKFFVALSGVKADLWLLLIFLAVNSVIGVYYYLRVVVMMFSAPKEKTPASDNSSTFSAGYIVLGLLAIIIIYLGISPNGILSLIGSAVILP
ncbi:MAG TPA: NADH-quinone oxidoreductase subunit N [Bacteroidales bacterium]|nr:NADH-quinone oxidoreductase subunit N [Bacteroidales bacterium]HRZ48716.1 NADH-quinone oxidoreductase subunit N [Bacteroidales bacterium]